MVAFSSKDTHYMELALKEAEKGRGFTKTNPLVGAVVVKDHKIISTGYHSAKGAEHAEAMAIRLAGIEAKGADLYVTLEPCSHWGKNPPCTDHVIKSGIKRVIVALKDPNPLVRKNDPAVIMRNKNILVEYGCCEQQAMLQNEVFLKVISKGLPFITIKTAMTLDGKIATKTGDSKWISAKDSRKRVHLLRATNDAVMIGAGTLRADDPSLTIRDIDNADAYEQPYRLIFSRSGNVPLSSKVFCDEYKHKTILVTSSFSDPETEQELISRGVNVINSDLSEDVLKKLLKDFGIASILFESGANIAWSFIEKGYLDKFIFFIAPKICGGSSSLSAVDGAGISYMRDAYGLSFSSVTLEGSDIVLEGYFS